MVEDGIDDPTKTTLYLDAVNTNGFSFDYRGDRRIPKITYGIDVTDASNFAFAPMLADGTVLGGVGLRDYTSRNEYGTGELNLLWTVNDEFKLRFGAQYRLSDFHSRELGRSTLFSSVTPGIARGHVPVEPDPAGLLFRQTGSDVEGRRATLFIDASASFALTDQFKLTAEAIELTDESTSFYIDSIRQDPLYESHVGRIFTLGASFKL